MKKFLLFIPVFILSLINTYPQWTNQNPVPDGNDLWSTFFIDDTGWIIGEGGFIKKTTNAGVDWIQQNSGTTVVLKSVQFINLNTGWICGEGGLILKTTDGGLNWFSLTSGTTVNLTEIDFYDLNTGYAVGYGGTILKTTDGGSSWTSLSSGTDIDLFSVDFVDAFVGYAVGGISTYAILKTTDGGATWIDKPGGIYMEFPLTVVFTDANTGLVGGGVPRGEIIHRTTDGGDTWTLVLRETDLKGKERNHKEQLSFYNYGGINSIYFKDSNIGYAVAGYLGSWCHRLIYTTTDGGSTWTNKYYGFEESGLISVYVNNAGKGWAVGLNGVIFITEDDGNSWNQILSGNRSSQYSGDNIYSVFCINENIGWAVGERNLWSLDAKVIILKTTNGGKIWKTQFYLVDEYDQIRSVYFINENIGWAISDDNSAMGDQFFRTTDGGENWISVSGIRGSSVFFIDQNTGWVTGDLSSDPGSGIYKSTDGGINWVQKSSSSSSSIYFSDINTGWAIGGGGSILKSTDGGETWVAKTSGTTNALNCVKFYDSNLGMCVGNGGIVLLSTDGGESWINKPSGTTEDLTSVTFTNSTTLWIAGSNGKILSSSNLGDNWTAYDGVTENDLTSLCFINEYTGWFGGLNGTMFKYFDELIYTVTLTSPNGWEIWKSGWDRDISWSSQNVEYINLYYSTDNGSSWNTIAMGVDASSGSYSWTVPVLVPFISLHCKVKIEDAAHTTIYDESDHTFIIWHACNVVKTANLGQQIIDFLETNIDISLNVTTSGDISVTYYPYESPVAGTLPSGVLIASEYYWQVSSPGVSFNNGKIIVPISTLRGVVDASYLVWLKRSNSGDPWENIGGTISDDNLESTVLFDSFSEFAIGSTSLVNPLPVELKYFKATANEDHIVLGWETKTEVTNYGFDIERSVVDGKWKKIGFIEGHGNSNSPKQYS
ncbi:MAG: hypothetical protein HKP17_01420, partial [Ignavibacteriaceae bacterium]|nr:hypothetical protein [Ignavibacteriaceae bacterium]